MKIADNNGPAPLTSGDMATADIGISDRQEDQLMILNVLSNTLYTDKVSAVLREYGCNAADANEEAGRGDQPIEVTLPNRLHPSVTIRDYGYGMTEDQILNVFCRLGRSTKRNSNAFTGMLGIGSKAGFAYGDHFLVTSFTNGTKSVYNAYRDRGAPKLAKMHECSTTEKDGIQIEVPVRTEDTAEFVSKAQRVFRYFKVRPTITGAVIDWADNETVYEGTGWRYTGGGESVAIMGNVGYLLSSAAMGLDQYAQPVNGIRALIDLGIELRFEIGELEIAANREGLQYKDLTKKALTARLTTAAAEIGKVFTDKISSAKSMWEAKKLYFTEFEQLDNFRRQSLKNVVSGSILWKGQKITSGEFNINAEVYPTVRVMKCSRARNYSRSKVRNQPNPWKMTARDATTIIINDLKTKKHSPSRIRGWFDLNPTVDTVVVFTFNDPTEQVLFWKGALLEDAPIVNLSAIAPAVTISSGSTTTSIHKSKHSAKAFVLDETASLAIYGPDSAFWSKEVVDYKDDKGVYVKLERFCVAPPPAEKRALPPPHVIFPPKQFINMVKLLRQAGLFKADKLFGFKPDRIPKLGKGWVPFERAIKKELDALILKKKDFAQNVADSIAAGKHDPLLGPDMLKVLTPGRLMHTYLQQVERMLEPAGLNKVLTKLFRDDYYPGWLALPKVPKTSFDLDNMKKNVLKQYPMLNLINGVVLQSPCDRQAKILAEYIKMVDSV